MTAVSRSDPFGTPWNVSAVQVLPEPLISTVYGGEPIVITARAETMVTIGNVEFNLLTDEESTNDTLSEIRRITKSLNKLCGAFLYGNYVLRMFSDLVCENAFALAPVIVEEAVENVLQEGYIEDMATRKSPFKTGRAGVKSSGSAGGQFLTLKNDGDSAVFAPMVGLDEMVSADMHSRWEVNPAVHHPCIGRKCPSCLTGDKPKFKGYLPIVLPEGDIKIWAFTITSYRQLEALEDEMEDGTLRGKAIKLIRRGVGLNTKWVVMGTGREIDVDGLEIPDFVPNLGPATESDINEALLEAGLPVPNMAMPNDDKDDSWGENL